MLFWASLVLLAFLLLLSPAVSGVPAVAGFPAISGVLAVASVADSGVLILAGLISNYLLYRTVQWDFRTIGISNMGLVHFRNYQTIGYRIEASIYRKLNSLKTIGCPPLAITN